MIFTQFSALIPLAYAQSGEIEQSLNNLSQEERDFALGLTRMVNTVQQKYKFLPAELSNLVIVGKILGRNGDTLPTQDEVEAPYRLSPEAFEVYEREGLALAKAAEERFKREVQSLPPLPHISTCNKSSTEKIPIRGVPVSNEVISDYLYVHAGDVPLKPLEAFGIETSVYVYTNDKEDSVSQTIAGLVSQVGCLPYRSRLVAGALYISRGGDALKNYDGNPHGRGIMHTDMKTIFLLRGWR
jgi:hypothetical protein